MSLLHVLTIQMKVSPAAFLLSVTWKCLQPNVLCIAVHLLPAEQQGRFNGKDASVLLNGAWSLTTPQLMTILRVIAMQNEGDQGPVA